MNHHSQHSSGDFLMDWLPVVIIVTIGFCYLYYYFRLLRNEKGWRTWQVLSFLIGITLLGVAMSPSMMNWGHIDIRGHMVQHLLIAMYAPIFLVLGAPLTLALKASPPKISRSIVRLIRSGAFRFVSHPITAFILNIGGMFVLYLTPLYNESLNNPFLHYFIHIHFLTAGYLFTWSIIGPDPVPNRPGFIMRLSVLFFSMATHAFLSKLMYAHLLPGNSPHSDLQIQEGAKLMYYWGDFSEIILVIILFYFWYHNRNRSTQNLTVLRKYYH